MQNEIEKNNEIIIISCLMRNPKLVSHKDLKSDLFQDKTMRLIFDGIKKLHHEALDFNLDTLSIKIKDPIDLKLLHEIYNSAERNSNIETHIEKLKNDYVKQVFIKHGVTKWINATAKEELIDIESLYNDLSKIQSKIKLIDRKIEIYDGKELVEYYKKELEKRKAGISDRWSYGDSHIDKLFPRPADEGQVSFFGGAPGSGKTLLTISLIKKQLVKVTQSRKKIPVVYVSSEMKKQSFMDRITTSETGISVDQLNSQMTEEEYLLAVQEITKLLDTCDNFEFTDEPSIGLEELDYIYEYTLTKFIEKGVIESDQKNPYMCMWFDTMDCLEIFDDMSPVGMKYGMNVITKFANKRNIHICLIGQLGEGRFRGNKKVEFDHPDECDNFNYTLEDIYGTSAAAQKVRATFVFVRPKILKIRSFPDLINELQDTEDILKLSLLKNNEGKHGMIKFSFNEKTMDFSPYKNN